MSETQTFTSEQQKALEQLVGAIQGDQAKLAATAADYINSAVTASFTVGPDGASLEGWITYTQSGLKIHFQLEGKPTSYWGLFAGAGALPFIGALKPEVLGGKVGTFRAVAGLAGGVLALWLNGTPVLNNALPLVGAGSPFGSGAEGKVRFSTPVS